MEKLLDLEREMEVLRAKSRRSERLAFLAIVLACLSFVGSRPESGVASATPSVVQAERFIVKDASGKTRAMLGTFDGQPGLGLMDSNGGIPALMSLSAEGSALELAHGPLAVRMGAVGDAVLLGILDDRKRLRIGFGVKDGKTFTSLP